MASLSVEMEADTRADRQLRARLHHGSLSLQVIALAAAGQPGMAAGQIRLTVVSLLPGSTGSRSGDQPSLR
jgi:hypothetical protein